MKNQEQLARRESPSRRFLLSDVVFLGVLIGAVGATAILPGGYDGWLYYLQPWFEQTTAPAWVHLFLFPVTLLPQYPEPYRWMCLVLMTVVAVYAAGRVFRTPWWLALFSFPMLWNIWLGQVEFLPIIGVVLGWLVLRGRLHPYFWGIGIVLLLTKVQVGWGLAVLITWWLMRGQGWRATLYAGGTAVILFVITLLVYPNWLPLWLQSLSKLNPQSRFFNSAVFPIGIVAWVFPLLPVKMPRISRARLVAAATLLGSPYFATYHCTLFMAMSRRWILLPLSFLPIIPMLGWNNQKFGWLIPVCVMLIEILEIRKTKWHNLAS
ncbi:MAG: hypothetical protein CUN56_00990 [Phototrophicales bacterium]|nr:MAG: hypothetical protein CUN56_00990 [Phototrophicales bacterium]